MKMSSPTKQTITSITGQRIENPAQIDMRRPYTNQ